MDQDTPAPPTPAAIQPAEHVAEPVTSVAPVTDDFYRSLRKKLRAWLNGKGKAFAYADMLLVAPDLLHLMCRLALDPEVTGSEKTRLLSAIAYFVSAIDLMPEGLLGPIGYLDDVALAAMVIHNLINQHGDIARKYWAGDDDLLEVIQRILDLSNKALGSTLVRRLRFLSAARRVKKV